MAFGQKRRNLFPIGQRVSAHNSQRSIFVYELIGHEPYIHPCIQPASQPTSQWRWNQPAVVDDGGFAVEKSEMLLFTNRTILDSLSIGSMSFTARPMPVKLTQSGSHWQFGRSPSVRPSFWSGSQLFIIDRQTTKHLRVILTVSEKKF